MTQLASGGSLLTRIRDRVKFTEKAAANTIRQLLDAVNYLHRNNIVHRGQNHMQTPSCFKANVTDLKLENILYLSPDQISSLVLIDFGLAKILNTEDDALTTRHGSLIYVAPEVILEESHGKLVDIWSTGVITFTLLTGGWPFKSRNFEDLAEEWKRDIVFHEHHWNQIRKDGKEFVTALLQLDANSRPTSEVGNEMPPFPALLIHHRMLSSTAGSTMRGFERKALWECSNS